MPDFLSTIFSSIWSVFLIVLFFGGSIFVHELGHFLAARRRGVKVTRFSIGFGPAIWKWQGKDGVEYRVAWLPLGGYVALPQLADMPALEGESEDVSKLPPISYSTRMIVFAAGAFFNVLFAFVLASILWVVGRPESEYVTSTTIGYVIDKMRLADGQDVVSPAAAAGLREGDLITAIDGTPVRNWQDILSGIVLSTKVDAAGERSAVFTIKRDGQTLDVGLKPIRTGDENFRKVGIDSAYEVIVSKIVPGSPASKLGLQADDIITAIDGKKVWGLPSLARKLDNVPGRVHLVSIVRGGSVVSCSITTPEKDQPFPLKGVEFRTNWKLLHQTPVEQIRVIIENTLKTFKAALHPQGDIGLSNFSGPIGIGRGFWDALNSDHPFKFALWFTVMVNISLAFFNLLPIPVLDGGHMAFATIARLRGKALSFTFIAATQSVFIVLLFSMVLYVTVFGDIRRMIQDHRAEAQAREAAAEQQKKAAEPAKP